MTRDKFTTRTILLKSELQRNTLLSLIPNLPLDAEKPLQVIVREEVKARGLDANGYYWLRIGEIASQAWFEGKQFSKEVWHIYLGKHHMPEMITTKDGEARSKWVESPDGSMVVISTTQLERGCFAAYTEIVEAFGASLGVQFSANPNERG
jgi:hypothetical protein